MIGRIKSGLYRLNEGHMYYGNNFVKIRLDLVNSPKSYKYKESEIFDFYGDILPLEESIKIRSDNPMDSIRYHRFIFVTTDSAYKQPVKIVMLPYLHERRIYLNRIKENT